MKQGKKSLSREGCWNKTVLNKDLCQKIYITSFLRVRHEISLSGYHFENIIQFCSVEGLYISMSLDFTVLLKHCLRQNNQEWEGPSLKAERALNKLIVAPSLWHISILTQGEIDVFVWNMMIQVLRCLEIMLPSWVDPSVFGQVPHFLHKIMKRLHHFSEML